MSKSMFDRDWEVRKYRGHDVDMDYQVWTVPGNRSGMFIVNCQDDRTLARYICKLHNTHLKEEANRKELADLAKLEGGAK